MESALTLTLTTAEDLTPSTSNFVPQSSVVNFSSDSNNNAAIMSSQEVRSEVDGPSKKKMKLSASSLGLIPVTSASALKSCSQGLQEKLEQRLGGILCCAVCLDLPKAAVYQCSNGHLMCSGCFTHLLADARLKDETASCPNCRCVLTRDLCSRNLAVEKAVSELPGLCRFCNKELSRALMSHHELNICEERLIWCGFSRIGCPWRGPFHELGNEARE